MNVLTKRKRSDKYTTISHRTWRCDGQELNLQLDRGTAACYLTLPIARWGIVESRSGGARIATHTWYYDQMYIVTSWIALKDDSLAT